VLSLFSFYNQITVAKMDMGGMGGMDMGSSMFRVINEGLSHTFWYIVAATVACLFIFQTLTNAEARWRYGLVDSGIMEEN
jgi:hypothetical protein